MVIKFNNKFESIFYAVLYSNLTGYYLSSKNELDNLLKNEDSISIDNLNWQEVLVNHNYKFGQIKWFINDDLDYLDFKNNLEFVLRSWQEIKYKLVINAIKEALKFGLKNLNQYSDNYQKILKINNQIRSEVKNASGYISFIPVKQRKENFLIGNYQQENYIGDLIIKDLQKKYLNYNFLLNTGKKLYVFYQNNIYQFNNTHDNLHKNFKKFWQQFIKDYCSFQFQSIKSI